VAQNLMYETPDDYRVYEDTATQEFFVTRTVRHPSGNREVQVGSPILDEGQADLPSIQAQFAAWENIIDRAVVDAEDDLV
jgi:hypothetical protein